MFTVFIGYVGRGMLSAAVAGSVFTSPPPQGILTGLRAIAKDNKGKNLVHFLLTHKGGHVVKLQHNTLTGCNMSVIYEGESINNQPNLFLGEIDLFFFDVIAL